MAKAMQTEGLSLIQLVGAKTGHSYNPVAKAELSERLDRIMANGREPLPKRVHFTTWTLRYNRCHWVILQGLEQHWERARVDAELTGEGLKAKTKNITAVTFQMPPGSCPFDPTRKPTIILDGQSLEGPPVISDRSWAANFSRKGANWALATTQEEGLHKRHGLQGPIDDAFMDGFLMVRPTGNANHAKVADWAKKEMDHAVTHWRKQFRGEARIKDDDEITEAELANLNLVLWGDPSSNKVLAKIADKLPVQWDKDKVKVGDKTFASNHHVPVLIYPNPLNPRRYVVINSGFTFREYDYLNNARQVPKLPDWAIVDIDVPVSFQLPGGIVAAGFFDEGWRLSNESK
jgi:hypothetical protein